MLTAFNQSCSVKEKMVQQKRKCVVGGGKDMNVVYVADVLHKAVTDTVNVTVKETSTTRESPLYPGATRKILS